MKNGTIKTMAVAVVAALVLAFSTGEAMAQPLSYAEIPGFFDEEILLGQEVTGSVSGTTNQYLGPVFGPEITFSGKGFHFQTEAGKIYRVTYSFTDLFLYRNLVGFYRLRSGELSGDGQDVIRRNSHDYYDYNAATQVDGEFYFRSDAEEQMRFTVFYEPRMFNVAPRSYNFSFTIEEVEIPHITITTAEELNGIRNNLLANYTLGNDIDLTEFLSAGGDGYNDGKGWQPIGEEDWDEDVYNPFMGIFDGAGYKITGLFIDDADLYNAGLFGVMDEKGKVMNLGLENVDITAKGHIGGLLGTNYGGTIENCYAAGNVSGTSGSVGGLVGAIYLGTIKNSNTVTDVSGASGNVGGLVGRNDGGSIENCYAAGDVSGETGRVGGLAGSNDGGGYWEMGLEMVGIIKNSYATGDVSSGTGNVGGLVGANGNNYYGNSIVENSYATGDVNGGTGRIGGLVGGNRGTIVNSYATGNVSGEYYVGGLVGENGVNQNGEGMIINSAALNPSVGVGGDPEVDNSEDVGRIAGMNDGGVLSGNVAFAGMTITIGGDPKEGIIDDADDIDGLGWTVEEILADLTLDGIIENGLAEPYPPYIQKIFDNKAIAAAKILVEAEAYEATQATVTTAAQARAAVEAIIAALNLNGVTAAVVNGNFTAATAGTVEELDGTNGSYTFTVTLNKGLGDEQETVELTLVITAIAYDPTQDNLDIAAAKTAIEAATFGSVAQSTLNTEEGAKEHVEAIIGNLDLKGVTAVVSGTFTAAAAGTAENVSGINGSYKFTVTLNKGAGTEATTTELTLTITATKYETEVCNKCEDPDCDGTCDTNSILTLNSQFSILNSSTPLYYTLKGQPLGTTKPTVPGVYIEKRLGVAKRIVVR